MNNQRCVRCNRSATYVSPEHFCGEHWLAWFNEDMPEKEAFKPLEEIGCPIAMDRFNAHVQACGICCSQENNFNYCAVGESLEEVWADTIGTDDDGREDQ